MTFPSPVVAFLTTLAGGSVILPLTPAGGSNNLPATNVVRPGVYNVFGQTVDMTVEGLYDIADFNGRAARRIVYLTDFDELLSAVANMTQLGDGDPPPANGGTPYNTIALTRKISTACGGASANAIGILTQLGFLAREVNGLTMEDFNPYDDGHTIDEVAWNGKYWAIDFDFKYSFHDAEGAPVDFLYVCDNIAIPGAIILRSLTSLQRGTDTKFGAPNFYQRYQNEHVFASVANTLDYYRRSFQMPYILANGGHYDIKCESSFEQGRATAYSSAMAPMSRADFIAKYYSSPIYHYGTKQNGTTGFGGTYSCVDRSKPIPGGTLISKLGLAFNNPHAGTSYFVAREVTPSRYDILWISDDPFTHPGGGYHDEDCGYATPADGGLYRMGAVFTTPSAPAEIFANGTINRAQLNAAVSIADGVTMSPQGDGTICMRWA